MPALYKKVFALAIICSIQISMLFAQDDLVGIEGEVLFSNPDYENLKTRFRLVLGDQRWTMHVVDNYPFHTHRPKRELYLHRLLGVYEGDLYGIRYFAKSGFDFNASIDDETFRLPIKPAAGVSNRVFHNGGGYNTLIWLSFVSQIYLHKNASLTDAAFGALMGNKNFSSSDPDWDGNIELTERLPIYVKSADLVSTDGIRVRYKASNPKRFGQYVIPENVEWEKQITNGPNKYISKLTATVDRIYKAENHFDVTQIPGTMLITDMRNGEQYHDDHYRSEAELKIYNSLDAIKKKTKEFLNDKN